MNISQPFYPRNCYYATNLTGTNSAEECLQSCNTWQNGDPRHKTVSFCLVMSMKIRIRKLEDHTFGSVLCESVDQIRWSVPLRIPTVMSSLFDPAAHSDGCPSQIGNQQKTKTLVQKDEEKGVCRFTKTKTKTNTNTKTKTNTDQTDCRKPTLLCRMTRMKKEDFQN